MRFKAFLENVVDGEDKFKQKRGADFKAKIAKLADEMPGYFQKQADLEKHVNDTIKNLKVEASKKLVKHKMEIAPILKHFREDTAIISLFYLLGDARDLDASGLSIEDRDLMVKFVGKHADEIRNVLTDYLQGLKDLGEWARQQKWPAGPSSLSRDTGYFYATREVELEMEGFELLLKDAQVKEEVVDARDKFAQRRSLANINRNVDLNLKGDESPAQKARGEVKAKIAAAQKIFADALMKKGLKLGDVNVMQFLRYDDNAQLFVHQHVRDIRDAAHELDKNLHAIYLELSKKDERHGLQAVQDAKRELKQVRRRVNAIAGKDIKPIELDISTAKKAIANGEKLMVRRTPRDEWTLIDSDHKWNVNNYYARMPGVK